MPGLLALNKLGSTDIVFFVVLAVLVVLCITVYFLIPLINKKQYMEMRDNLKKREAAFKSNVQRTDGAAPIGEALAAEDEEPAPAAEEAADGQDAAADEAAPAEQREHAEE